jgi:hypothetical protein
MNRLPKSIDPHSAATATRFLRTQQSIKSTCIASIDYNPETEEMDVTFVGPPYGGRGTWRYYDVPFDVYVDFRTAQSSSESFKYAPGGQGRYFNLYIRGQYDAERIG